MRSFAADGAHIKGWAFQSLPQKRNFPILIMEEQHKCRPGIINVRRQRSGGAQFLDRSQPSFSGVGNVIIIDQLDMGRETCGIAHARQSQRVSAASSNSQAQFGAIGKDKICSRRLHVRASDCDAAISACDKCEVLARSEVFMRDTERVCVKLRCDEDVDRAATRQRQVYEWRSCAIAQVSRLLISRGSARLQYDIRINAAARNVTNAIVVTDSQKRTRCTHSAAFCCGHKNQGAVVSGIHPGAEARKNIFCVFAGKGGCCRHISDLVQPATRG